MSEPIQTTDEVTETTAEVSPEVDQETVAPAPTADEAIDTPTADQPEQPSPETQPQAPDYKDKFVASQRESILNNARVEAANAQIESLTKTDTPTDEAMRALYPEWDQLDEYNKRVLVRQETIAMQNARTLAKQQAIEDRQQLEDQLDNVIDNEPKLAGKEAEFKKFARNPKNRGIAADVLAKAFLFDVEDETPQTPTPQPMTEALPTGSGGPRGPQKPKKMSLEDASILRQTNYEEWRRLALAGEIEDDI